MIRRNFPLFIIFIAILVASYCMNISIFIGADPTLLQFFYSLIYLIIWLFFLIHIVKTRSEERLKLYLVFWMAEVEYFLLAVIAVNGTILEAILITPIFLGLLIFLVPLMGFAFISSEIIYIAVSIAMLLIGFIVKKIFKI